jgi:hypothetical protein
MARRLREAAKASGDNAVPGNEAVCTYVRRWERGSVGPSERYKLYYCRAFGITPEQMGLGLPGAAPPARAELAYRGTEDPGREVVMAAHEGSEHAEHGDRSPAAHGAPAPSAREHRLLG